MTNITRRNFIGAAASTAGSVAMISLTGCGIEATDNPSTASLSEISDGNCIFPTIGCFWRS